MREIQFFDSVRFADTEGPATHTAMLREFAGRVIIVPIGGGITSNVAAEDLTIVEDARRQRTKTEPHGA